MHCHTVARIRLKLCGNSLRVHDRGMGYLIFLYTHIIEQILSKLVETFLGSQKQLICTCVCACQRYARWCTRMRACVRSHICRRIRSKSWYKHQSACATCFLRAHLCVYTMRTLCACLHYTHVRAHTLLNGLSPKLMETFLGSKNLGIIDFYVRACVCILCAWVRAHARMCEFTHFWTLTLFTLILVRRSTRYATHYLFTHCNYMALLVHVSSGYSPICPTEFSSYRPLLFVLYINEITKQVNSCNMSLMTILFREISSDLDCKLIKKYPDSVYHRCGKWHTLTLTSAVL
jgi:hypothetical protein